MSGPPKGPRKRAYLSHRLSYTPEYRAWQTMRLRCTESTNPAYPAYGGRGITICDRWLESPAHFIEDMGRKPTPKHEIDRIDNDKGYSKENCRWATRSENDRNRRSTRWVEYHGERRKLADLMEEKKMTDGAVYGRLKAGWSIDRVFDTPVQVKDQTWRKKRAKPSP